MDVGFPCEVPQTNFYVEQDRLRRSSKRFSTS